MRKPFDKSGWLERVKAAIDAGKSQKEIAADLGTSMGTVSIFVRRNGMKTGGHSLMRTLAERRARAIEPQLRELAEVKRYGAEDIGPKVGISPSAARKYMKLLGIKFPTNGRTVLRYDTSTWGKDVLKWHRQGKGTEEIARLKGVSKSTIYRYLANGGHITVRERDIHA